MDKPSPIHEDLLCALLRMGSLAGYGSRRSVVDAVTVYPGVGEPERVDSAIAFALEHRAKFLYVAGVNTVEIARGEGWEIDAVLARYPLIAQRHEVDVRKPPFEIVTGGSAAHTSDQARATVRWFQTNAIHTAILTATGWHLPRAFLTLVRQLVINDEMRGALPLVIPLPADRPLNALVWVSGEHGDGNQRSAATTEVAKMLAYQPLGYVATLEDLETYLRRIEPTIDGSSAVG